MIKLGALLCLMTVDVLSKIVAASHLLVNERVTVFGREWIQLTRVVHRGLMFQWASAWDEPARTHITFWFPAALWVILVVLMMKFEKNWDSITRWSVIFFMSGALGNMLSLWIQNESTDYLLMQIGARLWLPFNISDLLMLIGALMLFVASIRTEHVLDQKPIYRI